MNIKEFISPFKKGISMGIGFLVVLSAAGMVYAATTLSRGTVDLDDGMSKAEMQVVLDSLADIQNSLRSKPGLSLGVESCTVGTDFNYSCETKAARDYCLGGPNLSASPLSNGKWNLRIISSTTNGNDYENIVANCFNTAPLVK